jgi:hypothetical protein
LNKKKKNLDQIRTEESKKRRKKLGELAKITAKHKPRKFAKSENPDYKLRYLQYPTAREKGKKPAWNDKPNFRRMMQVGIWIKSPTSNPNRKSWKLYKGLQESASFLRAVERPLWESELQAAYNSLRPNTRNIVTLNGKTMREALNGLSVNLQPGDRVAIVCQMQYETANDGGRVSVSYVELFKKWHAGATMLGILRNGLADNLRGALSARQVTFTNAREMEKIYTHNKNAVEKILVRYGLDYDGESKTEFVLSKLLDAAGYFALVDAKDFGDQKFIKDYQAVKELYIPDSQLEAKVVMDQIKKPITITLDYRFLERR